MLGSIIFSNQCFCLFLSRPSSSGSLRLEICGKELAHSQTTNVRRASKPKGLAYYKFKFDENGVKSFKWVENTMGKGEIARNMHNFTTVFSQDLYYACKMKLSARSRNKKTKINDSIIALR